MVRWSKIKASIIIAFPRYHPDPGLVQSRAELLETPCQVSMKQCTCYVVRVILIKYMCNMGSTQRVGDHAFSKNLHRHQPSSFGICSYYRVADLAVNASLILSWAKLLESFSIKSDHLHKANA